MTRCRPDHVCACISASSRTPHGHMRTRHGKPVSPRTGGACQPGASQMVVEARPRGVLTAGAMLSHSVRGC